MKPIALCVVISSTPWELKPCDAAGDILDPKFVKLLGHFSTCSGSCAEHGLSALLNYWDTSAPVLGAVLNIVSQLCPWLLPQLGCNLSAFP